MSPYGFYIISAKIRPVFADIYMMIYQIADLDPMGPFKAPGSLGSNDISTAHLGPKAFKWFSNHENWPSSHQDMSSVDSRFTPSQ